MVRLLGAAALWCAAAAASAQTTVQVQSGEHDGFTRLALTFGRTVAWELTRSADGYVLTTDAPDLRYDLSRIYQRISRQRFAEVSADPESGSLRLDIACACHALPFEYRPGILVIDVRDGPAPAWSSFERGPDGLRMAALTEQAPSRPRERNSTGGPYAISGNAGYDWIALATGAPLPPAPAEIEAPPPAPFREDGLIALSGEGMAELRRALLYDLARGAAEGAVTLTQTPPPAGADVLDNLDQVEVRQADRLAAMIGVDGDKGATVVTADGTPCIADDALDVESWGDPRPVAKAIGPLTAGLYGEFDRVDTDVAGRAVRYLLSLGFGAEAGGMIRALDMTDEATPAWSTMARVMDGDIDPDSAFAGMAGCDTAAALWSVLAMEEVPQEETVNTPALLRAFSDLPPHLRRNLGRALSDRMLSRGDTATVRMVLKAMERTPGEPAPGSTLVDAGLAVATGEPPDVEALSALRTATGPDGLRATIALIRASLDAGEAVNTGLVAEAEARLMEFADTPEAPLLQQALAEAQASQGNFARAFDLTAPDSPSAVPIWATLGRRGSAADLLERAVLPSPAARPLLPAAVRQTVARRLIDLGFAEPALVWTGAITAQGQTLPQSMEPPDRMLSAEAELLRRNPDGALRQLDGIEGPEADALRLKAYVTLDDRRASALATVLGDASTAAAVARREGAWQRVAETGPEPWQKAAAHAGPVTPSAEPALAKSRALLADSAAARADLSALLDATEIAP